jgi:tripartite-type tricarboxylate transporter receptor subunit TctC
MRLPRRKFLHLAAGAAALPAVSRIAYAQNYPNRVVRIVIPYTAGGGVDLIGRLLANELSAIWGQQVIAENRGGAGGNIGAQAIISSPPDGYSLLLGSVFLGTNPYLYPSLGYDPLSDLAPISKVCVFPNLMVVPKSSPAKTVSEFVAYAKANPGKVAFGSSGVGASPHLSGELFKRMANIEMTHVPYRGGAAATNDLLAGHVDTYFGNLPGMLPQVQSGALRGLAVTSASRAPSAPQIPTIAESGVPEYDVSSWYALFMHAKTPADILKKVHRDVVAALAHPTLKQKIEESATVTPSTQAELAAHLKSELTKWGPIIKAANIKGE